MRVEQLPTQIWRVRLQPSRVVAVVDMAAFALDALYTILHIYNIKYHGNKSILHKYLYAKMFGPRRNECEQKRLYCTHRCGVDAETH